MVKTRKLSSIKADAPIKKAAVASDALVVKGAPELSDRARDELRRIEEARRATAARAHSIRMG